MFISLLKVCVRREMVGRPIDRSEFLALALLYSA
jgi:hypothetical protein